MRIKFICCEVFTRPACLYTASSPHVVDIEFTPISAHEDPDELRSLLQSKISAASKTNLYDYIILGFGLCGNGTLNLRAETVPLIIPRAHDCCTLYLGSSECFLKHFSDNLSSQWSCCGYIERGASILRDTKSGKMLGLDKSYTDMVELYGEENAQYLWETLHPNEVSSETIYIETPETKNTSSFSTFKQRAETTGKDLKVIQGDMSMLKNLIYGNWDESSFLTIMPGQSIHALYDYEKVFVSK